MDEINLKIRKRAMSSKGRARIHTDVFDALGLGEGASIDLFNPSTGKSVTVASFADSLVEEGYIRISSEDIENLGLTEESTVLVKKTPPIADQAKALAKGAADEISKGLEKADATVRSGAKAAAEKADETGKAISGEITKAADSAAKKAGQVKDDLLRKGEL